LTNIVLIPSTGERTITIPKDQVSEALTRIAKAVEEKAYDEEIKSASIEVGKMRKRGKNKKRTKLKSAA
jgi:hypothetical protein